MKVCISALFASCLLVLCAGGASLRGHAATSKIGATSTAVAQGSPPSVVGQPYSATIEVNTVKTLADGTQIIREGIARKEYRDSEGRTRIEYYMLKGSGSANEGKLMFVIFHDPTKGVSYLLNARNHTVRQMVPRPAKRDEALVAAPAKPARPIVEDLGTQTIEGLVVEGKRTTHVIPAGALGNDRPMEIVTERWFSKELGINVLMKNSDPRQGESTMWTTNIDRSEPDPALFKVPADYAMQSPRSTF